MIPFLNVSESQSCQVLSLPGRPALRDKVGKTAVCCVSLIPRLCGVGQSTPQSSGFKIPRRIARNFETQGQGFPVILLAHPRSKLQGYRDASFSGALHLAIFEPPIMYASLLGLARLASNLF
jgi:hypothetical protein